MNLIRKNIIKFLSTVSLLIFFLPFFQTCSDKTIKSESSFLRSYAISKTESEKEIAFQKAKRDFSISGYELAISCEPIFLGFSGIMILNFTFWICLFRGHKNLLLLTFLNLVFIFFSFLMLVFALPDFGQIRYGFYACMANSLILFYLVYKEQDKANNY
jgi:hypothetical protein